MVCCTAQSFSRRPAAEWTARRKSVMLHCPVLRGEKSSSQNIMNGVFLLFRSCDCSTKNASEITNYRKQCRFLFPAVFVRCTFLCLFFPAYSFFEDSVIRCQLTSIVAPYLHVPLLNMMTMRMPGNAKLNALGEKCVLSCAVAVRGGTSAHPMGDARASPRRKSCRQWWSTKRRSKEKNKLPSLLL